MHIILRCCTVWWWSCFCAFNTPAAAAANGRKCLFTAYTHTKTHFACSVSLNKFQSYAPLSLCEQGRQIDTVHVCVKPSDCHRCKVVLSALQCLSFFFLSSVRVWMCFVFVFYDFDTAVKAKLISHQISRIQSQYSDVEVEYTFAVIAVKRTKQMRKKNTQWEYESERGTRRNVCVLLF